MMLEALSLVYLNPWVTLLSHLNLDMAKTAQSQENPRRSKKTNHQFELRLKKLSGTVTSFLGWILFLAKKSEVAAWS